LAEIPVVLVHEPWKLNALEQQFYNCAIGTDYPYPIVDIDKSRKEASDIVWSFKKQKDVQEEGKRILKKHVNSSKTTVRNQQLKKK
jgi:deoxyribodipyrimidine photo-lyase